MVEIVKAPKNCILFATADWDEPYWTNKQHCAKSLAELGTKVLYVESVGLRSPKAGSAKDWKRLWNRLCKGVTSLVLCAPERSPGILVLSPLLIPAGHRYSITRSLNRLLLKATIARTAARHDFDKPLIWTYHPFMLDVLDDIESGPFLYHCVDDLAAIPGIDGEAFRAAERLLLERVDVVFATAPSLAEYCKQYNANSHYLPNVVDAEHFGRALDPGPIPADLARIPEPRLCFHGVLSDFKVDFQLLIDSARLKPEWSWILIGEEREGQQSPLVAEIQTLPNVHLLGFKPYDKIPEYLRGAQVGLLPSLMNEYTQGMFPMKYYEYLAAGLPIASTPLAFTQHQSFGTEIGLTPQEFTNAISLQLLRGKISRDEIFPLVAVNNWISRLIKMLSIL